MSLHENHPYFMIVDEYEVKKEDTFEWVKQVLTKMSMTGEYDGFKDKDKMNTDEPFDMFDSETHKISNGISLDKELLDEEDELIFLINLSEHIKRPKDMLMFLGEYFKKWNESIQLANQHK